MSSADKVINVDAEAAAKKLFVLLLGAELFFVLLDIVVNYFEAIEYASIQRLCNIAREDSLAAWFMTSQTLVAGLVLWLLFWLSRSHSQGSPAQSRGWLILALFFTYMSADDGALIHERIGTMFEEMLEKPVAEGGGLAGFFGMFPSYEWHFLLPFFALIGLYVLYFLWRTLGIGRQLMMVLAAFFCFAVAVVLDFIEGMPADHELNLYSWMKQYYALQDYTVDHFAKSLEEFLEMLGISLFLVVFVGQIHSLRNGTIRLGCAKDATRHCD